MWLAESCHLMPRPNLLNPLLLLVTWLPCLTAAIFIPPDGTTTASEAVPSVPPPNPRLVPPPNPQSWAKEDFPNPQTEPARCGQTAPSFICDPAQLLDPSFTRSLSRRLEDMRKLRPSVWNATSTCQNGTYRDSFIKIAVAVTPDITGHYETVDERETARADFARHLRLHSWQFDSGCRDDMVIVFFVKETGTWTSIRISIGAMAVPAHFNNTCVTNMWKEKLRQSKAVDLKAAISTTVTTYKRALLGHDDCSKPMGSSWPIGMFSGLMAFAVVYICYIKCRQCHNTTSKPDKEIELVI